MLSTQNSLRMLEYCLVVFVIFILGVGDPGELRGNISCGRKWGLRLMGD